MARIHWLDPEGGDFADAANWRRDVLPGAGDRGIIDVAGTYTITLSSAATLGSLTLNDAGATVSLGGGADLTLGSNLTLEAGLFVLGNGSMLTLGSDLTLTGGQFDLGGGSTISGGTLRATGGKFLWGYGTLDGVTYDGPLDMKRRGSGLFIGPNGLILTGRDGTGTGTANLSGRGTSVYFKGTQTFDNATVNMKGSDVIYGDFAGGTVLTLGEHLTINHTGPFCIVGGAEVVNRGIINANSPVSGADRSRDPVELVIDARIFTNQGSLVVSNGDQLGLEPSTLTNLVNGTLTGGIYEVDAGSLFAIGGDGEIDSTVVTDDAVITLSGVGSDFEAENGHFQYDTLESTLTTIGAAGTLNLLAGRDWTSTNALTNAGALVLGGGTFTSSALTNSGVISGSGVIGVAIANSGIIEAASGALDLAQAITGSGTMKIDAGATLELGGAAASSQTVRFFEGAGTLELANPSAFAATLHGFAPTDTIDLLNTLADAATLGAGDTLVISDNGATVATLQRGGDYTAATFNVASDGQGRTNITVTLPGAAVVHPAPSHPFIAAAAGLGGSAGEATHAGAAWAVHAPMLARPHAMIA